LIRFDLKEQKEAAWDTFVLAVHNFFGSHKADNYADLEGVLVTAYQRLGCRLSMKMYFFHSQLTFFPSNMGAMSDEHGESFQQETGTMKATCQGFFNPNLTD